MPRPANIRCRRCGRSIPLQELDADDKLEPMCSGCETYRSTERRQIVELRHLMGMDSREPWLEHSSLARTEPDFYVGDVYSEGRRPLEEVLAERRTPRAKS